jgi:hypothetical protein
VDFSQQVTEQIDNCLAVAIPEDLPQFIISLKFEGKRSNDDVDPAHFVSDDVHALEEFDHEDGLPLSHGLNLCWGVPELVKKVFPVFFYKSVVERHSSAVFLLEQPPSEDLSVLRCHQFPPEQSQIFHIDLLASVPGDFCQQFEPAFDHTALICLTILNNTANEDLNEVE